MLNTTNPVIMMQMYFYNSQFVTLWFEQWSTNNWTEYIFACLGTFALAWLWEYGKIRRSEMDMRLMGKLDGPAPSGLWTFLGLSRKPAATASLAPPSPPSTTAAASSESCCKKKRQLSRKVQLLRSAIGCLHYALGWFVMLAFMTFNVGVCVSIVLGNAWGYYLHSSIQLLGDNKEELGRMKKMTAAPNLDEVLSEPPMLN
eukprot:m.80471 g.80471  ORF g.80471 m.80471 type:complete len:201 (+) comp14846_c0_seq6:88-690(+)